MQRKEMDITIINSINVGLGWGIGLLLAFVTLKVALIYPVKKSRKYFARKHEDLTVSILIPAYNEISGDARLVSLLERLASESENAEEFEKRVGEYEGVNELSLFEKYGFEKVYEGYKKRVQNRANQNFYIWF
jgi:hypothetical protein